MKTREESNALKADVETPNSKLAELTNGELSMVSGGTDNQFEKTAIKVEKTVLKEFYLEKQGVSLISDDDGRARGRE